MNYHPVIGLIFLRQFFDHHSIGYSVKLSLKTSEILFCVTDLKYRDKMERSSKKWNKSMFPSAQLFKHYIECTTHRCDNNILWPYKYDAFIRLSIRTKILYRSYTDFKQHIIMYAFDKEGVCNNSIYQSTAI